MAEYEEAAEEKVPLAFWFLVLVLFSQSPDERLEILWTGDIENGRPRHLVVRGEKSRWRAAGGLAIGLSLQARFAPVQNERGEYVDDTERYVAQVGGEREYSSGHPGMQALNPVISEIFVQYQH